MALALPLPEPPWPASLTPLKAVDALLRCGICFDYFSIAMMIPQCSHNYCSLCIRKFLSYKTQCPTCCVAVSESDLKNNRTLDELVKSFNSARQEQCNKHDLVNAYHNKCIPMSMGDKYTIIFFSEMNLELEGNDILGFMMDECSTLVRLVRIPSIAAIRIPVNNKKFEWVIQRQQLFQLVLDTPLISSPLACSRHSAGKSHVTSPVSRPVLKEEVPVIDSFLRKEKVCTSTKADGLAGTAQETFKTEEHHNLYSSSAEVDGKDDEVGSRESPECTKSHEKPSTSVVKVVKKVECPVCEVAIPEQYINKHLDSCLIREEKKDSLRSSAHKRKPMSKVVYNLLSDRDLKKKLKEHGLSTRGTRQQLIKRHQEFVHMYNSQCDSLNPKSVAEVVKELEENEKIRVQLEFNKNSENSLTFTKDQTEEEIDEIHADYRNKHRSEFQFLVDQVNKRWKKSGKRKTERAQNKKVVSVKELPVATEHREEHHTATALGKAQVLKTETPDGKSEPYPLEEGQRSGSPALSLSSGSTSSSSSDILRDLQGPETCLASSDNSSFLDLRVNKRKSCQPPMPENDQLLPESKRKKS